MFELPKFLDAGSNYDIFIRVSGGAYSQGDVVILPDGSRWIVVDPDEGIAVPMDPESTTP